MDPYTLRLYAEVVLLKERLATTLRENEEYKHTLEHMIRVLPRLFSQPHLDTSFTSEASTHPIQESFTTTSEVSTRPRENFTTASEDSSDTKVETTLSPDTKSLLDEPPKLDLAIRGTKTTHDIDLQPLVPLPTQPAVRHGLSSPSMLRQESPTPIYIIYGIRYHPPSDIGGTFHQVVITGLPLGLHSYSLLHQVRGSMIVSCQILDTLKLTGSFSALVRFVHEAGASEFVNHTAKHPMVFGNRKVTTALIKTPSYPLPDQLHRNIFFNNHTRCLKVEGFTHNPMRRLQEVCQTKVVIESARLTPGAGALIVHFTSVQQASEAYYSLKNTSELATAKFSFLADPCAQPF